MHLDLSHLYIHLDTYIKVDMDTHTYLYNYIHTKHACMHSYIYIHAYLNQHNQFLTAVEVLSTQTNLCFFVRRLVT